MISPIFQKKFYLSNVPPPNNIDIKTLEDIDHFRPFGIGNPKPLFILENVTIDSTKALGQEEKHLSITISENPSLKLLLWNASKKKLISYLEILFLSLSKSIETNGNEN